MPVYLITIFSKGEKVNLSESRGNELKGITKNIVADMKGGLLLKRIERLLRQKVSRNGHLYKLIAAV